MFQHVNVILNVNKRFFKLLFLINDFISNKPFFYKTEYLLQLRFKSCWATQETWNTAAYVVERRHDNK